MSGAPHKPPRCFDTLDQYNSWRNLLTYSGNQIPSGYCTDCLPSYKARMQSCGRCQWPATTFVFDSHDGTVIGVRKNGRIEA